MPVNTISTSINEIAPILKDVAFEIHANPELGLEEFKAVERQVKLLKEWGFEVTTPFCGMATAYKATRGSGNPVFCFMAEYDALPGVGHACGHNLITIAALGAGKALADTLKAEKIPGTVVVMGTPGEEGKGGKVEIVTQDALKDVDAVIMAHPGSRTKTWKGCFAVERFDVEFTGKASHAAGAPEKGVNALDAVMLLFHGINAWRQHLPEKTRIHGIVTDGGDAPNIVPEHAAASFYLRADSQKQIEVMIQRFKRIAEGAALMTDAGCVIESRDVGYKCGLPNETLNHEYFQAAAELGMNPHIPEEMSRASTDFGDVSHALPGTHVYFGILEKGQDHALHTTGFAEAAKSDFGIAQALNAAQAIAQVGYRFFTDPELRKKVKEDYLVAKETK